MRQRQARALLRQQAALDLGHFQMGGDRAGDGYQIAVGFELLDEIPK
nr:hypothetical protein [Marinicauda pacifica]